MKTLKRAFYWLRCHLWDRYHILDLSHADRSPDGYRWGWCDRDHLMYLACFKLLTDFVENEAPEGFGTDEYESPEQYGQREPDEQLLAQIARHKEIRALYEWWTVTRPAEHKAHERAVERLDDGLLEDEGRYCGPAWEAWCDEEQHLEDVDDEMLLRLMAVRKSLWT